MSALGMVGAGLVIGVPLAIWGRRLASAVVMARPGTLAIDAALPIIVAAMAMVVLALVAAYLPARRAARVQPIEALRQ